MVAAAIYGEAWEDSGCSLMARIRQGASNVVQADISSITYTVVDKSDGSTVGTSTLTVSTVIFNSLQTDARWSKDSTGYNFRWDMPASLRPNGDRTYRAEVKFTPASGEVFFAVFDILTPAIYGS